MDDLVLTNDTQRREFLANFWDWEHITHDTDTGLDFHRYTFSDGSFITVISSRRSNAAPITTLTKPGEVYFPKWSTQGELWEHLRKVAGKR